jgi:hypothetical protein
MSQPEEFGDFYHREADGWLKKWFVWAIIDPITFEVNWVYYGTDESFCPLDGYRPCECTDAVKKAALKHVQDTIAASDEVKRQEENFQVIDDDDPGLPQNVTRLH